METDTEQSSNRQNLHGHALMCSPERQSRIFMQLSDYINETKEEICSITEGKESIVPLYVQHGSLYIQYASFYVQHSSLVCLTYFLCVFNTLHLYIQNTSFVCSTQFLCAFHTVPFYIEQTSFVCSTYFLWST